MEQDIFAAITANDKERVTQLLAADPSVARARNAGGISALMQARYENRMEIVELLRQAAGELDVFESAALGDVARLKKLLASDHELVSARSSDGFTPLHLACFFGQLEAAESPDQSWGRCQCGLSQPNRGDPQRGCIAQRSICETRV